MGRESFSKYFSASTQIIILVYVVLRKVEVKDIIVLLEYEYE